MPWRQRRTHGRVLPITALRLIIVSAGGLLPGCTTKTTEGSFGTFLDRRPDRIFAGPSEAYCYPPTSPIRPARIVAVHGFPGSALEFAEVATKLSQDGYEVWLLNAPGHGKTERAPQQGWAYRLPEYGKWLAAALHDLPRSDLPNYLLAHSAGAEVCVQALEENTAAGEDAVRSVQGLLLINPWIPSFLNDPIPWDCTDDLQAAAPPIVLAFLAPWACDDVYEKLFSMEPKAGYSAAFRAAHEALRRCWPAGPYKLQFAEMLRGVARAQRDALNNLLFNGDSPLWCKDRRFLILSAADDRVIPYKDCKYAYQHTLIRRFEAWQSRGALGEFAHAKRCCGGHMVLASQPEWVTEQIKRFLQREPGFSR